MFYDDKCRPSEKCQRTVIFMKVLVTGSFGFTGRFVCEELINNEHSICRLSSDLTDSKALSDEIDSIKPDAVIHLAAVAFVGFDNANSFYEVNLVGTRNLLLALSKSSKNLKSVLIVSSANVYGNHSGGALNEEVNPNPVNDYAVSKLAMEKMANLWIKKLPIVIVRPFNYTGLGQDSSFLIPKIVAHFQAKKTTIELGNLDVWREFGDVRTVSIIYRKLLELEPIGELFNICTGQPYSLREVVALCQKITGHSITVKVNPEFIRDNEIKVLKGDNSRLKGRLYDWPQYELEETLSWMLNTTKSD